MLDDDGAPGWPDELLPFRELERRRRGPQVARFEIKPGRWPRTARHFHRAGKRASRTDRLNRQRPGASPCFDGDRRSIMDGLTGGEDRFHGPPAPEHFAWSDDAMFACTFPQRASLVGPQAAYRAAPDMRIATRNELGERVRDCQDRRRLSPVPFARRIIADASRSANAIRRVSRGRQDGRFLWLILQRIRQDPWQVIIIRRVRADQWIAGGGVRRIPALISLLQPFVPRFPEVSVLSANGQ
jgi:hypothetical protein